MNILQQISQRVESVATPVTIDVKFVKDLFPFVFPKEELSVTDSVPKFKSPTDTAVRVPWPFVLMALLFALYMILYMADVIIFLVGFIYPLFYSHILVTQSASQNDLIKIVKYWMLFTITSAMQVFIGFPVYLRLIQVYMLVRDEFEYVTPIYDGICQLARMAWGALEQNFGISRFFVKNS